MRPCHWFGLAALGLCALGFRATAERARAQPMPLPPPDVAAASRGYFTSQEVKGYGETPDDAKEAALDIAQAEASKYFRLHVPAIGDWMPSQASLLNKKVIGLIDDPQQVENQGLARATYEVKAKVEITPKSLQELTTEARTDRMHDRHLILARILAGIVVVLLVMSGYLRLEDATRGYYTTMLRLAAVGVVGVVVAG